MKIGIVGLPNVGKSTLFQALTKKEVDRSNYPFATIDPNVGVVEVPDHRLDELAKFSNSKKKVPAIIEFVDIAGLIKGASAGEGLGNQFLSHIREVDAIVEVVRVFKDPGVTHVEGENNPRRDIEIIETELILKDLETCEKALARFEKDTKTGDKKNLLRLEKLKKIMENLKAGKREIEKNEVSAELQLLGIKPILYCFNGEEGSVINEKVGNFVTLDLKKELDENGLNAGERKELGLSSQLPELIKSAYEILQLISFFTTGEDESRAWRVPQGSSAPRAGRAIHSDFENKFIKASVISYQDLMKAGSFAKARERGLLRTEGKEYIVKDGDIIEFKI